VEIGLNPVAQDGHSAVLATVVDISARKQADLARRLLVDELEHRTRNFFNVVEALVLTSAKGVESVPEFAQLLVGRVNAVSQAYALVGPTGRNVSLLGIMRSLIAAHAGRIAVDVEDIEIAPSMAQTFALVLHELATNALKYGALAVPDGRVVVHGAFDPASREALYVFTWREHDGPPVAEPTRSGFGTVLLTKLAAQFAEQVDLQYAPDGLLYRLHIRRARIESEPQAAAA
jgi:two-component system CheB/CheR fusion protein